MITLLELEQRFVNVTHVLRRLSAESNRLRIVFLRNELGICSTFVNLTKSNLKAGRCEDATRTARVADRAYRTMEHYLSDPKHAPHIQIDEYHRLMEELKQLRRGLDHLHDTLRLQQKVC